MRVEEGEIREVQSWEEEGEGSEFEARVEEGEGRQVEEREQCKEAEDSCVGSRDPLPTGPPLPGAAQELPDVQAREGEVQE